MGLSCRLVAEADREEVCGELSSNIYNGHDYLCEPAPSLALFPFNVLAACNPFLVAPQTYQHSRFLVRLRSP